MGNPFFKGHVGWRRSAALPALEPTLRTKPRRVLQAELCERFLVRDYPTMLFGPAKGFVGDPKLLDLLPPVDTADELLKWINQQLSTYVCPPTLGEVLPHSGGGARWVRAHLSRVNLHLSRVNPPAWAHGGAARLLPKKKKNGAFQLD